MTSIGLNHRYMVRNFVMPAAAWDPSQLPNLFAWYDASNAASLTTSGSPARASQWNDLSGNGRHLTQPTGVRQPESAVNTQNGLNTITFLQATNLWMSATGLTFPSVNTLTAYVAFKPTGSGGAFERVLSLPNPTDDFNSTGAIAGLLRDNTTGNFGSYYNNSMRAEKALSNAAHVLVTQRNGDTSDVWVDGAAGTTVTGLGTTNFNFTVIRIGENTGNADSLDGDVYELFLSSAADSTANRQSAEAYLKAKWATP